MVAPTTTSPNVGNIQVGKGVVSFKKTGSSTFRDVGNVTSMIITPNVTTLEHYTSRLGTKQLDEIIILEKRSKLKIIMEEYTADNLSMLLLGTTDNTAVGGPTVDIFQQNIVSGEIKFVGANDIGPQVTVDLYYVSFIPTGNIEFIADKWGTLEADADVLIAPSGPNIGKFGLVQFTNVAPDAYASDLLTFTGQPATTQTVTIGGRVYTFQTVLTNIDGNVFIGATLAASILNLQAALNNGAGAGTAYAAITAVNNTVNAPTVTGTTLKAQSDTVGVAGNTITAATTVTGATWASPTFTGGAP